MVRIAFLVTRSDTIGGSHIHVRDMAKRLKKNGHEAIVLIGGNGPILEHFRVHGLEIEVIAELARNINPVKDILAYKKIRHILRTYNPDLISTHSSKAGFLGRIAAKNLGIPVIFTAHGWSFTTGKTTISKVIYRYLEKVVAPITDKIITVSNYDKQLALEYLGISNDKVITIHNGIMDLNPKTEFKYDNPETVHIVKVARFDAQKDHIELLEAVCEILPIHLHFVGDGPLMDKVKAKAEELGISDRITYWGRLDDVSEVLSGSHLFTLISNWEGFPRSTLEAMRNGLPVIVSDVGGSSEAIEHGVSGYVVPKGNVSLLKNYINELVQNPKKRYEMGEMARKRYEESFTFKRMYNKTFTIYNEVLNR